MTDTTEDMIQAARLTAPRITPADIQAAIVDEQFIVSDGTMLTVCILTLRNGFTVTGESACASPANFNAEIGKKIARENAERKIWPLLGYVLKQRMYESVLGPRTKLSERGHYDINIAQVCHEVNRTWCAINGDFSQPAWPDAPHWQKNSAINGVMFHVENPDAEASSSHENWMAEKLADGWTYGETKDPEAKTHPCLVPFDDLPHVQQVKDRLFRAVVHAMIDD